MLSCVWITVFIRDDQFFHKGSAVPKSSWRECRVKKKEKSKRRVWWSIFHFNNFFLNGLTHRYVQSNVKFDRLKSLFCSSVLVLLFLLVRMCVMLTLINIIGIDLLGGCLNLVKEDKKSSNPPQALLNFLLL